ncbi:MAG: hypothetical protein KTR16_07560 [Acidiferrobacterales bacterium]|nr:hypothetical protein [Acidiferrobacterales bacterium]
MSIIDRVKDVGVSVSAPDAVQKASPGASTQFHKEATASGGLMVHNGLIDPKEICNEKPSVLVLPSLDSQS